MNTLCTDLEISRFFWQAHNIKEKIRPNNHVHMVLHNKEKTWESKEEAANKKKEASGTNKKKEIEEL